MFLQAFPPSIAILGAFLDLIIPRVVSFNCFIIISQIVLNLKHKEKRREEKRREEMR
jgi:hypothetical protein